MRKSILSMILFVFLTGFSFADGPVKIINPYAGSTEDRIIIGVPTMAQHSSATSSVAQVAADLATKVDNNLGTATNLTAVGFTSSTNSFPFTKNGTNYVKVLYVGTNGMFEATTVEAE